MPATATSPSSVKAATDEPGYPAGLPGRANRVLFVMPGQPGRATRLVCRGTRAAQIFRQKSIACNAFSLRGRGSPLVCVAATVQLGRAYHVVFLLNLLTL